MREVKVLVIVTVLVKPSCAETVAVAESRWGGPLLVLTFTSAAAPRLRSLLLPRSLHSPLQLLLLVRLWGCPSGSPPLLPSPPALLSFPHLSSTLLACLFRSGAPLLCVLLGGKLWLPLFLLTAATSPKPTL